MPKIDPQIMASVASWAETRFAEALLDRKIFEGMDEPAFRRVLDEFQHEDPKELARQIVRKEYGLLPPEECPLGVRFRQTLRAIGSRTQAWRHLVAVDDLREAARPMLNEVFPNGKFRKTRRGLFIKARIDSWDLDTEIEFGPNEMRYWHIVRRDQFTPFDGAGLLTLWAVSGETTWNIPDETRMAAALQSLRQCLELVLADRPWDPVPSDP